MLPARLWWEICKCAMEILALCRGNIDLCHGNTRLVPWKCRFVPWKYTVPTSVAAKISFSGQNSFSQGKRFSFHGNIFFLQSNFTTSLNVRERVINMTDKDNGDYFV